MAHQKNRTKVKANQRRSVPELHKNGELAVFYNIAYNRTSNFIKTIQRKDKAQEFTEIRDLFFPKHSETNERKRQLDFSALSFKMKGMTDRTYSELKVFFWNTPKGKNIRYVTPQDIEEINHILLLLLRLRDYHSHYWHEETAIYPTNTARIVLERMFEIALRSYQPQISFAIDVSPYEDCWDFKDDRKLSTIGIDFFLGFFLTRGQMELYMKSRQYLNRGGYSNPPTRKGKSSNGSTYLYDTYGNTKRHSNGTLRSANDVIDLEKSRFIASFYAQRDASESAAYWLGKHTLFDMDVTQYHTLQVTNYLGSLPTYLFDELSDKNKLDIVRRTTKRPTTLLATSIALLAGKQADIEWRVYSDEVIQTKVSHGQKKKEDLQKTPEAYYTAKPTYVKELGTVSVTADRLHQETETVQPESVQILHELYESGNRIMLRIEVEKDTYMHLIIGHQNIKHWSALVAMSRLAPSLEALRAFATAFMSWLQSLKYRTSFSKKDSFLAHFDGVKNSNGATKYKSLLPTILLQLEGKNVSDEKAIHILRTRIKQKIKRILNKENNNHFAALVQQYNQSVYRTGYFNKKEQDETLKKINTIKNRIKAKKATDTDIIQKRTLERQWRGKVKTTIRHEKMQLLYKSLEWILGKKGKFSTAQAKKQFAKYCYLLDVQAWKEDNLSLIADWLDTACTAKVNLKKHTNDQTEIYQRKVQQVLLQAISFDNCFERLTKIALDKYEEELRKIDTYTRYENLIGLARKLDISNPSNTEKSNTQDDSKHSTRKDEILAPFYKQDDEGTHGYVFVPHDFFLIAPQTREALKLQFKKMPETKTAFKAIKARWQSVANTTNYQTYFADFQETNRRLKEAKTNTTKPTVVNSFAALKVNPVADLTQQRQKIKQWYEDWYTDVVLTLLQGRLLQKDSRLPLGWNEKELIDIRKNKKEFIKKIDNVRVSFPIRQLKSNDFYSVNRIENIVKRLKQQHPTKTEYTYQEIKTAMQLHWKESIWFVSQLLSFEKSHKKMLHYVNDNTLQNVAYASFKDFETELGTHFKTMSDVRNKALHADILPPELSYTDLAKQIAGLKKRGKSYQK